MLFFRHKSLPLEEKAFFYLLFSVPQSHSRSSTATSECPRSVSEYSTFGGIWG